jgi:small subunit ribosomal protein S18
VGRKKKDMSVSPDEHNEKMSEEAGATEEAAPDSEKSASRAEEERPQQRTGDRAAGGIREARQELPRGRPYGRGRDREGGRRERRMRRPRRKVCAFCVDKVTHIDYKDHARLRGFISDRGKILKSRMTGTCARHQRKVDRAIKWARQVALLAYVAE